MPLRTGRVRLGFTFDSIEAMQDWFLTLTPSQRWDLMEAHVETYRKRHPPEMKVRHRRRIQ